MFNKADRVTFNQRNMSELNQIVSIVQSKRMIIQTVIFTIRIECLYRSRNLSLSYLWFSWSFLTVSRWHQIILFISWLLRTRYFFLFFVRFYDFFFFPPRIFTYNIKRQKNRKKKKIITEHSNVRFNRKKLPFSFLFLQHDCRVVFRRSYTEKWMRMNSTKE